MSADEATNDTGQSTTFLQSAIIEFSRHAAFENGAIRKYGGRLVWRLRHGWVDYDYHGLTLRLDPLYGSSRVMLMTPYWYDRRERSFIKKHLPDDGVFLDIGANAGFYTFFAAAHRPRARVVSFECIPEHVAMLRYNIAANGLTKVEVESAAVSSTKGVSVVEGRMTPTISLLEAASSRGIERIDVLKIDIEGMEDKALLPFFEAAPRSLWPRAIVGEHISAAGWYRKCRELGYREHWRTRYNCGLTLAA